MKRREIKREREKKEARTHRQAHRTSPEDTRNKPETFQGDAVTNHKWPKMVEITSNLVQLHNRRISLPAE